MSSCRMMRRRDAPSDSRMPISRWRETPRASSRLATLAQPIVRISPKAKNSGEKTSSEPDARRPRACPGAASARPGCGCPGTASSRLGSSRCPRREGGCRRLRRQPRLQPPDDLDGDLVLSSCIGVAELPGERKRRPVIGRSDAEPAKAVGHDADDLVRRAVDRPRGGRSPPDRPRTACAIPRDSARSPAGRQTARRLPASTGARARPGRPAPGRSSR